MPKDRLLWDYKIIEAVLESMKQCYKGKDEKESYQ